MNYSVSDNTSEFWHYTDADGILGILTSGTLRATNTQYLNDKEEIVGFMERKFDGLVSQAFDLIKKEENLEKDFRSALSSLRQMMNDLMGENPIYVASLSKATSCNVDGVLSQWRGYGRNGGYAIVFDGAGIEKLIKEEKERFGYVALYLQNIIYDDSDDIIDRDRRFIADMARYLKPLAIGAAMDLNDAQGLVRTVISVATSHKHKGFSEEQEIRILACPLDRSIISDRKLVPTYKKELKETEFRIKDGLFIPFLSLFNREKFNNLPVKKIVVGPHKEKEERKKSIAVWLKHKNIDVEVEVSDIPYIG